MKDIYILAIESSCDDTSAAVLKNNFLLSNIIANQKVHQQFGGVVPELASRAHQQNIIPVVEAALLQANVSKNQLNAIAYTGGPGLMGSLLVGISFAKAMALALDIPLIQVDHMQAHIMALFIEDINHSNLPQYPLLCLTVSGGHTQITKLNNYNQLEIIGKTIDDAAGEAFDKAAKVLGLPYPGGPIIDKLAKEGNANAFQFSIPKIADLNYSFSGLKTSFLYFIRDQLKKDSNFIENNLNDLCASYSKHIVLALMDKLDKAAKQTNIKHIAVAGGVSANSMLRTAMIEWGTKNDLNIYIPPFTYCTDNAAMVGVTGYYHYINNQFGTLLTPPYARQKQPTI